MTEYIFNKFSGWLFPLVLAVLAWGSFHYFVLAPRILMADLPEQFSTYAADNNLPARIGECVQDNIADALIDVGRIEAAIWTGSFGNVHQPFDEKLVIAEQRLDGICGIGEERKRQLAEEQKRLEAEQREKELARAEALAQKKRELEKKAQEEYQKQVKQQIDFIVDLFTGEK